jgi:hypothetical protein
MRLAARQPHDRPDEAVHCSQGMTPRVHAWLHTACVLCHAVPCAAMHATCDAAPCDAVPSCDVPRTAAQRRQAGRHVLCDPGGGAEPALEGAPPGALPHLIADLQRHVRPPHRRSPALLLRSAAPVQCLCWRCSAAAWRPPARAMPSQNPTGAAPATPQAHSPGYDTHNRLQQRRPWRRAGEGPMHKPAMCSCKFLPLGTLYAGS